LLVPLLHWTGQVKSASDFIDEGNQDMVQAVDLAIAIRKKQACVCLIVLVVLGAIVGIIFAVSGGKK
jgi:t-SNARE complex subunit (syntaxin)